MKFWFDVFMATIGVSIILHYIRKMLRPTLRERLEDALNDPHYRREIFRLILEKMSVEKPVTEIPRRCESLEEEELLYLLNEYYKQ